MQIKICLDDEVSDVLIERAVAEKRPIPWQIEVELRRALGLPFPRTLPTLISPAIPPAEARHVPKK
jgi:hypothetical protein